MQRVRAMEQGKRSGWAHFWLGVPVLAFLAMVDGAGVLRFGRARLGPDLVLVAVILWAFLGDAAAGAIWGFLGGLMLDTMSAAPFATHTVAMVAVGATLGAARLSLYADDQAWALVATVVSTAGYYAFVIGLLLLQSWPVSLAASLRALVLPSVAIDAVTALILLPVFRLMQRRLFAGPVAVT